MSQRSDEKGTNNSRILLQIAFSLMQYFHTCYKYRNINK